MVTLATDILAGCIGNFAFMALFYFSPSSQLLTICIFGCLLALACLIVPGFAALGMGILVALFGRIRHAPRGI